MRVVYSARKPKGLKTWVGVIDDIAPHIIVDALGDAAVCGVDDEPGAAQVIRDDAVGLAVPDHVVRHVGPGAIDEPG